jgi:hypothetical protein
MKGHVMTDRCINADHLHDPAGRPAFGRWKLETKGSGEPINSAQA